MSLSIYAASAFSTLFRLAAYAFLEVIPHDRGKLIVPTLYVLYITSLYLQPPSDPEHFENGVVIIESKTEEVILDGETDIIEETNLEITLDPTPEPSTNSSRTLSDIIRAVVFSLPSPFNAIRSLNFIINTLLLLAVADFVLYPLYDDATDVVYTRVGAVYPDSVKIVIRHPGFEHHQVLLQWRQASVPFYELENQAWNDGPLVNVTEADDWVNTVTLAGLWPSTNYEYRLAYPNGTSLAYPAHPIQFHTFPDPRLTNGSYFRFIATSCMTPNFPYKPFHGRSIHGMDLVSKFLWPREDNHSIPTTESSDAGSSTDSPPSVEASIVESSKAQTEFMIFMGDFIYADVPVYWGDDKETYRRLYRRNYQSESFRQVHEKLPIFHTYDDHEIINNYAGQANDTQPPFPNADDAYELYNAKANYDSPVEGQHYYEFRHGDIAFFVLDTRRYRSDVQTEDVASRTMLGDQQLASLYEWLGRVNNTATFKFIVSSVPFTSLWQHDALIDSWAAFEAEKYALLSVLHTVPNVVILSGDRHEFAAIKYTSEQTDHRIIEVSTSPLSMFYVPFIRTLKMESDTTVCKTKDVIKTTEDGATEVATIVEDIPQEQVIKYIAEGNYKWSAFEVDTRDPDHPTVQLEVIIDGSEKFRLVIDGTPVKIPHTSAAMQSLVPQSLKGILDRVGIRPSRWF